MIRYAEDGDFETLKENDRHIHGAELENSIRGGRILMLFDEKNDFVGWLRFNLFWDNTPFLNLLYILENHRGRGHGTRLLCFWEREMSRDYKTVLTSTLSSEEAQFFYRKNGYTDCGALLLPNEPLEIIMRKDL